MDPSTDISHVAVMPDSTAERIAVSEHGTHFRSTDLFEELSRGGMVVQCGFPRGSPVIAVAVDGQTVRWIRSDLYDSADALPEEDGLPFADAGPQSSLFLIEKITGMVMTPRWMLGPFMVAAAQLS